MLGPGHGGGVVRIGSLFSGYGGLDHAVQMLLGGRVAWVCDNDPGASKILAYRYPGIPNLGDVTAVDWTTVEPVDVLTAGFPCQPASQAGRRGGADDERWLFGEITRALSDMVPPPRLCLFENVAGLLSACQGDLMARVVRGLAAVGYVGRWRVVRASGIGAAHRRERVFIVAHAHGPAWGRVQPWALPPRQAKVSLHQAGRGAGRGSGPCDWGDYAPAIRRWEYAIGRPAPAPTEIGRNGQPRLSPRFVEWMMGLPDGWVTDVPGLPRNDQLKALGNGVVPQQATAALRLLLTEQVAA
jgi:DNA (cytosine-5)-methyltransferase 1